MKSFAVAVAFGVLSQTAVARTTDCKSITESAARLTCYDKAKAAAARPAKIPVSKTAPTPYVDQISDEDGLMNARLKNICRGV